MTRSAITDPVARQMLWEEVARRRADGDEQAATIIECDLAGAPYPDDVLQRPQGKWAPAVRNAAPPKPKKAWWRFWE